MHHFEVNWIQKHTRILFKIFSLITSKFLTISIIYVQKSSKLCNSWVHKLINFEDFLIQKSPESWNHQNGWQILHLKYCSWVIVLSHVCMGLVTWPSRVIDWVGQGMRYFVNRMQSNVRISQRRGKGHKIMNLFDIIKPLPDIRFYKSSYPSNLHFYLH